MVDVQVIPENDFSGDLPAEVELRIKRLEAAVTALQDTPLIEERVAERVIQRLKRTPIKALRESAEALMLDPNRVLPPESEAGNVNGDVPRDSTQETGAKRREDKRGWFLFDLWSELRYIGRMFYDHRYHFTWIGRIGPTVIMILYVLFYMFSPLGLIERIADVALIVILYHILAREARMYRSAYP